MKLTVLAILVLAVLVAVLLLVGGGEHGPGRHADDGTMPAGASEVSRPSGGTASGHTPPFGGHE